MNNSAFLEQQEMAYPYFFSKDNTLSIWDDPSIQGGIALTEPYQPLTQLSSVLNRFNNGFFEELDIVLLKVLGDAISANEDHLKRYMGHKMTRTQVSNRLKRLRQYGFVDRWSVESSQFPDNIKPPAPFTLGIAGYILLKQLYFSQFFMNPQKWQESGLSNIQRYVATNEIRCQLFESRVLRNWVWNGVILNNPYLFQPFATAEIDTPDGRVNLVIERVQQGKKFLPYLEKRLEKWEMVLDKYEYFPIKNMNPNPSIIVIYVSSHSLAEYIKHELVLDKKTYTVWFCIEEELVKHDISRAFYMPIEDGELIQINMEFLSPNQEF